MAPSLRILHLQPSESIDQRSVAAADQTDYLCGHVDDEEQYRHDDKCRIQLGRFRKDDGNRSEKDADEINRNHSHAMGQAHLEQTVVQMAFIRCGNRLLVYNSADNREERVPERYAEHHDRDDKRNEQRFFKAHDRERRQVESQKKRARIAHENAGRVKVEIKEAQNRSKHDEAVGCNYLVAHQEGHDRHRRHGDSGNACGQAIETVDQVNRVGHADNPEDRKRDRQPCKPAISEIEVTIVRQIHNADLQSKRNDHHGGTDQLPEKLHLRGQLVFVVQHPDSHDDRAADKDAEHLFGIGHKEKKCYQVADINGQTAHSRHDAGMNFSMVRSINRSYFHS